MSLISNFIESVQSIHTTGKATENSYRSCFETLFSKLDDNVRALNEPKRVKCGAPDFNGLKTAKGGLYPLTT